ncbi:hypothetical protein [Propionispira arboris]|nr:hypothetical protein [Propionispira arboris]
MMMWYKISIVCFFIAILGYLAWNNEDGRNREVRIIQEYQTIQQPQGVEVIFYKVERKFVNRWIFSCYKYPMSVDEVQRYYEELLKNGGWTKKKRQIPKGKIAYVYEKENLEFGLQLNENGTWTVSMGYNDVTY